MEAAMSTVAVHAPGRGAAPRTLKTPTIWGQLGGLYTDPTAMFQRLARAPSWGQALWILLLVGWVMMALWASKVDVDALQRPILEQNSQLSPGQIDQAIEVSRRFILPIALFSNMLRSFFGVLTLGLVFWLFALSTDGSSKPSFLHALSAATVPGLVLVPWMLMIAAICASKPVGAQIPERLAPSGLAYYIHPGDPKLYALSAQVDPFVVAYYVMLFIAARHTMRLKSGDALVCAALAALLTIGWKVYFWV